MVDGDVHNSPKLAATSTYPQDTGMRDMFALIRHNAVLVLFMVLLSLGAGTGYLAYAPARYIASATLLVDTASSSIPEEYFIESQAQMMRSDLVLHTVIERLDLIEAGITQDDSSFFLDHARAARDLAALYVPALASDPEDEDPLQRAVSTLRRNLTIMRPAVTPIVSIAYNSTDPGRAANVVNTLIDAYISQRRLDEKAGAQQSVAWLAGRLNELRRQLEDAEREIESFRIANSIVGAGTNHSLQAEQRLYELGIQRDAARAAVDRAQARYAGTLNTRESALDTSVASTPAGSEIAMLSTQDATEARQQIGPREKQHLDSRLSEDLADALRTQASLERAFEEAARRAGEMNRQIAQLRELEASTAIYRTLYGNMLERYEESVQQSSLPVNGDTRVLIAARRPDGKSHPRPLLVLAFAGAFGVALGVGVAALRLRLTSDADR